MMHPYRYVPVYDGVYHTPLGRFSMVDISTVLIVGIVGIVGIVPVPKTSALERCRRELLKTYRSVLAPSWLSSNRAWKKLRGGVSYTPSHTIDFALVNRAVSPLPRAAFTAPMNYCRLSRIKYRSRGIWRGPRVVPVLCERIFF